MLSSNSRAREPIEPDASVAQCDRRGENTAQQNVSARPAATELNQAAADVGEDHERGKCQQDAVRERTLSGEPSKRFGTRTTSAHAPGNTTPRPPAPWTGRAFGISDDRWRAGARLAFRTLAPDGLGWCQSSNGPGFRTAVLPRSASSPSPGSRCAGLQCQRATPPASRSAGGTDCPPNPRTR